jgi:hypothetical protein
MSSSSGTKVIHEAAGSEAVYRSALGKSYPVVLS